MSERVSVSVIGPGALGSAMIDLVNSHTHFNLQSVWGSSVEQSFKIDSLGNKTEPDQEFPSQSHDLGRLTIISVPDDQISAVSQKLSQTDISWDEKFVIHLSGSHDSTALKDLEIEGATIGSLHPLQTFKSGDGADRFNGIWFSGQGSDNILSLLTTLIEPTGGHLRKLSSSQKSAMHLAAVFASNYLVSLMEIVDQITSENNIDDGLEMLEPIVRQTFENIISNKPVGSLSGPVARGDLSTIEKHLEQLQNNSDQLKLYCQMGLIASDIALKSGQLDETQAHAVRSLLERERKPDE